MPPRALWRLRLLDDQIAFSSELPLFKPSTSRPLHMFTRRLMWIAWPAFLIAGVIEMLLFAVLDPQSLQWFGQPLQLSREAIYTLAFFVIWVLTMISSGLTVLLGMSSFEVNR